MTPINDGAFSEVNESGIDEAADAFAKAWGMDAPDEPSKDTTKQKKEKQDEPAEDDETDGLETEGDDDTSEEAPEEADEAEGDEDEDEDQDDESDEPTVTIKDDHKFKVTVDGEEQEFTLGSLKRLAGQEASLTRKSQKVAADRKTVDESNAAYLARAKQLLDRAQAKYEPYSKLDFLALAKDPNISQEELVAVRNLAQAAHEDVQFLTQETTSLVEALREQRRAELMEQARESIKVLTDPEKGIEGYNDKLHTEICAFAIEQGMPADIVNELVDPSAIKIINMARLYAKGKKSIQTAKSDKQKAPKRIVKGTATPEATKKVTKNAKAAEPMKRLQKSGSVDDAADAFMARWNKPSED